MIDFFAKLFGRRSTSSFDIEKAVGKLLLEMPRCPATIVIASPRQGFQYFSGEIHVDSLGLLPWAEHHAVSTWSNQEDEQAARRTLPIWLRGADRTDLTPFYLPKPFPEVVTLYASKFFEMGIAKAYCPECDAISSELTMSKLNERHIGRTWHYWTDDWRCPAGHIIYHEDHEMHLYFGPSNPSNDAD